MWVSINKMEDAPDHDCLVVYITSDQQKAGNIIDDMANLGAGVGWLSWSRDKTFWSIIDDGEIIVSTEVVILCEITRPYNIIAGIGAILKENP